jgi:hypothetical protein
MILVVLALHLPAHAFQGRPCVIAGRVVDALTREPLEKAIVFLSGSSIGTSTRGNGTFLLRSPVTGGQDLVVSLVGYDRKVIHLQLPAGDSVSIQVVLSPHVLPQTQVQVVGGEVEEWKKNLAVFENIFLGRGEFARSCRLLNPYVVDLTVRGDTLSARSDSLLWVENPALGYRMRVAIGAFEWDLRHDQGVWAVYVLFQEYSASSPEEREDWLEHRKTVYQGSMRYFFRSLILGRASDEGFQVRAGRSLDMSPYWPEIERDSLPLSVDSTTHRFQWTDRRWIRVDSDRRASTPSFFRVVGAGASVDSTGLPTNPLAFEIGGKWGGERMGSLLPTDYVPDEHRR